MNNPYYFAQMIYIPDNQGPAIVKGGDYRSCGEDPTPPTPMELGLDLETEWTWLPEAEAPGADTVVWPSDIPYHGDAHYLYNQNGDIAGVFFHRADLLQQAEEEKGENAWELVRAYSAYSPWPVYASKCPHCGFVWTKKHEVKEHFKHCPGCGHDMSKPEN